MTNTPRRAMHVQRLPLNGIGYLIQGESGPVAVLSAEWGSATGSTAVENMYNAIQPEAEPAPRARIRKVS